MEAYFIQVHWPFTTTIEKFSKNNMPLEGRDDREHPSVPMRENLSFEGASRSL